MNKNHEISYGPLAKMLGTELRKSQLIAEKAFINQVSPDLLPGHLTVLTIIQHNQNISQSMIAEAAGLDRSSLVPILKKFESMSLISRRKSPEDSRKNTISLTSTGIKHIEKYLPNTKYLEKKACEALGEKDYKNLINLLIKFQTVSSQFK